MRFASTPTACTSPVRESIATTDGSDRTIPRPRTYTRVFAVPRSTAMSRPPKPVIEEKRPMPAMSLLTWAATPVERFSEPEHLLSRTATFGRQVLATVHSRESKTDDRNEHDHTHHHRRLRHGRPAFSRRRC